MIRLKCQTSDTLPVRNLLCAIIEKARLDLLEPPPVAKSRRDRWHQNRESAIQWLREKSPGYKPRVMSF